MALVNATQLWRQTWQQALETEALVQGAGNSQPRRQASSLRAPPSASAGERARARPPRPRPRRPPPAAAPGGLAGVLATATLTCAGVNSRGTCAGWPPAGTPAPAAARAAPAWPARGARRRGQPRPMTVVTWAIWCCVVYGAGRGGQSTCCPGTAAVFSCAGVHCLAGLSSACGRCCQQLAPVLCQLTNVS